MILRSLASLLMVLAVHAGIPPADLQRMVRTGAPDWDAVVSLDSGLVQSADCEFQILDNSLLSGDCRRSLEGNLPCPEFLSGIEQNVSYSMSYRCAPFELCLSMLSDSFDYQKCQVFSHRSAGFAIVTTATRRTWSGFVDRIHAIGVDIGGNRTTDLLFEVYSGGNGGLAELMLLEVDSDNQINLALDGDTGLLVMERWTQVKDFDRDGDYELLTCVIRSHAFPGSCNATNQLVPIVLVWDGQKWRLNENLMICDTTNLWLSPGFADTSAVHISSLLSRHARSAVSGPRELSYLLDQLVFSGNAKLVGEVTNALFPREAFNADPLLRAEFDSLYWYGLPFHDELERINGISLPNPSFEELNRE